MAAPIVGMIRFSYHGTPTVASIDRRGLWHHGLPEVAGLLNDRFGPGDGDGEPDPVGQLQAASERLEAEAEGRADKASASAAQPDPAPAVAVGHGDGIEKDGLTLAEGEIGLLHVPTDEPEPTDEPTADGARVDEPTPADAVEPEPEPVAAPLAALVEHGLSEATAGALAAAGVEAVDQLPTDTAGLVALPGIGKGRAREALAALASYLGE